MPAFGTKMVSNFKTFIVLGVAVFALLAGAMMTTTGTVHAEADDDIEVTLIYNFDDDKVDVFVARYGLATEHNGVLLILSAAPDGVGNLLNSTVLGGVVVTGCAAAANLAAANCSITSYSTTVSIAADATTVYVDYVFDEHLAAHTVAAAQTLNAIDEDVELNSQKAANDQTDVGTPTSITWITEAGAKDVTVTMLPGSYRARAGEGVRITSTAKDSGGDDFYTAMVDTDPTALNFNWQSNPGVIVASTTAAGVASYSAPRRQANDTITARVGYDRPASAGNSATVTGTTYFRTIAPVVEEEVVVEEVVVEEPVVGAMTLSVSAQIALALAALTLIGGGTAVLRRSRRES
jgi:hypothetical protein